MPNTIQIDGMEELRKKLQDITEDFSRTPAGSTLHNAMKRSLYIMVGAMAKYPKQDPASAYRRTGTLGRRWVDSQDISSDGHGITGKIGNNTEYAPWVQSHMFQTKLHRANGWITDQEALDKNEKAIRREFQFAVDKALRD